MRNKDKDIVIQIPSSRKRLTFVENADHSHQGSTISTPKDLDHEMRIWPFDVCPMCDRIISSMCWTLRSSHVYEYYNSTVRPHRRCWQTLLFHHRQQPQQIVNATTTNKQYMCLPVLLCCDRGRFCLWGKKASSYRGAYRLINYFVCLSACLSEYM